MSYTLRPCGRHNNLGRSLYHILNPASNPLTAVSHCTQSPTWASQPNITRINNGCSSTAGLLGGRVHTRTYLSGMTSVLKLVRKVSMQPSPEVFISRLQTELTPEMPNPHTFPTNEVANEVASRSSSETQLQLVERL